MTNTPAKNTGRKASTKSTARKAAPKASPKASTKKAPAARKATARKAAPKASTKASTVTEISAPHVAIERIKVLRSEGVAWRPLSATLNAEGITTVRGKTWSANGSSAFLLARKNGIS